MPFWVQCTNCLFLKEPLKIPTPKNIVKTNSIIVNRPNLQNKAEKSSSTLTIMLAEDKENVRPSNINPSRKMRRGFSALLESAVKEHMHEIDEKVAFRSQCKDITNMVDKLCNDFDREDKGRVTVHEQ